MQGTAAIFYEREKLVMVDIIVVGGGPAGMTAALYGLRNAKSVLVIEKNGFGGQITFSPKVENIPGFTSVSGNEFAEKFFDQIMEQGAEVELDTVIKIEKQDDIFNVYTEDENVFQSKAVILATGVKHRMLGLEGEDDLVGNGISFCAVCDGDFYKDRTVCVAGGGNSALQEAILLSSKCREVIMLQDLPQFTGEKKLQEILFSKDNVKALPNTRIKSLIEESGEFKGVVIEDKLSGNENEIRVDGMFVAIGLIPENKPFESLVKLNDYGYFDVKEDCITETEGLFVAGDCRSKKIRQVTTANGDGAVAALAATCYIDRKFA